MIASVLLRDQIVVQSIAFQKYLPIGKLDIALEFLSEWGIDEIVILDLCASQAGTLIDCELLGRASRKCQVPIAVGGGIRTLEHAKLLAKNGADKIIVNQAIEHAPGQIKEISKHFGKQFVIASVDVAMDPGGEYGVYDYNTKGFKSMDLNAYLANLEQMGVGEILVNSVDRDGSLEGYDLELFRKINTPLPLLFQGGAKNAQSIIELFAQTEAQNAVAGNFFHYFEHSVPISKIQIAEQIDQIRLDSHYQYQVFNQNQGRISKCPDQMLENLLFEKIEKEIL